MAMSAARDSEERRGFRVSGRVQGVGFRWSTARRAEELGLRGAVRNCADGTVEVAAEGPAPALRRFAEWLEQGPRGAHVAGVESTPPSLPIPEVGFRIL
jgi:acylphosphatase